MGPWKCFSAVLAISCCVLIGPCLSAPGRVSGDLLSGAVGEEDSARSSSSSAAAAFSGHLIALRSKRQTGGKQCQAVGEYCKYAEECCSGLCLSFSYKCVTRPPQSEFTPVIQNGPAQGSSVDDIVNRFGAGAGTGAQGPSSPTQCREVGGYCSRSSDCCSGLCLSFSYKCVTNNNPGIIRPPSGPNNFELNNNNGQIFEVGHPRPQEITIEELVNRFGGSDAENTVTTNSLMPSPTRRPDGNSQSPMGSGRPMAASSNQQCISTGAQCNSSNQCCSSLCVRIGDNNQLCAEQIQQTPSSPPSTACLSVGFKCYAHAECCTGRCHMFLHQCVT